jgi:hypothetical protein
LRPLAKDQSVLKLHPAKSKRALAAAILALSGVVCVYSVALTLLHFAMGSHLAYSWLLVFSILLSLWIHADTRLQRIHQPLDFGFIFLGFWPLALPYYLIKTRGTRGIALCAGFFATYLAPFALARGAYLFTLAR